MFQLVEPLGRSNGSAILGGEPTQHIEGRGAGRRQARLSKPEKVRRMLKRWLKVAPSRYSRSCIASVGNSQGF